MDEIQWTEIRRLRFQERYRIRAIARHLGIDRRVVSQAHASPSCPKPSPAPRGSILDAYIPALEELLEKYPRLSGVRCFEKLRDLGYPRKLSTLRQGSASSDPVASRQRLLDDCAMSDTSSPIHAASLSGSPCFWRVVV